MNRRRPTARYQADGWVTVTFPFHAGLIGDIKALVHAGARSYNPVTHEWTIAAAYADRVVQRLCAWFPDTDVQQTSGGRATPPPPPRAASARQPYTTLHLLPTAPPEVVGAAYRALAKLHHPDRLPDTERDAAHEAMVAINAAYAALEREGRA